MPGVLLRSHAQPPTWVDADAPKENAPGPVRRQEPRREIRGRVESVRETSLLGEPPSVVPPCAGVRAGRARGRQGQVPRTPEDDQIARPVRDGDHGGSTGTLRDPAGHLDVAGDATRGGECAVDRPCGPVAQLRLHSRRGDVARAGVGQRSPRAHRDELAVSVPPRRCRTRARRPSSASSPMPTTIRGSSVFMSAPLSRADTHGVTCRGRAGYGRTTRTAGTFAPDRTITAASLAERDRPGAAPRER